MKSTDTRTSDELQWFYLNLRPQKISSSNNRLDQWVWPGWGRPHSHPLCFCCRRSPALIHTSWCWQAWSETRRSPAQHHLPAAKEGNHSGHDLWHCTPHGWLWGTGTGPGQGWRPASQSSGKHTTMRDAIIHNMVDLLPNIHNRHSIESSIR